MIIENILNFLDVKIHHKHIYNCLKNLPIKYVIDVGAHKGEFASMALRIKSIKEIICFEPQKKVFKSLKENLANNDKIIIYNLALGNSKGKMKMKINKIDGTSSLAEIDNESLYLKLKNLLINNKKLMPELEEIDITTFDIFFKNEIFDQNTLLKIDIEGYEEFFLKGSRKKIKEIKYVLIENQFFKMYKNHNFKNCHELLINNNFRLLKKFKAITLHYEDRLYINESLASSYLKH